MARLLTVAQAVEAGRIFLFDTSVLIPLADTPDLEHPAKRAALTAVARDLIYAIDLTWWEFLRGRKGEGSVKRDVRERRRKWLKKYGVKLLERHPPEYGKTFHHLLSRPDARGDAVDGALAAFVLAAPGRYVIATADADDFCWHGSIELIGEFLDGACNPASQT